MNYSELSDFEINKRVAEALDIKAVPTSNKHDGLFLYGYSKEVDFCNNPSDAWPIIVQSKLALIPEHSNENEWFCGAPCVEDDDMYEPWFSDPNPLRAAMICFLMMQEG